jgi:hypothetical protein
MNCFNGGRRKSISAVSQQTAVVGVRAVAKAALAITNNQYGTKK